MTWLFFSACFARAFPCTSFFFTFYFCLHGRSGKFLISPTYEVLQSAQGYTRQSAQSAQGYTRLFLFVVDDNLLEEEDVGQWLRWAFVSLLCRMVWEHGWELRSCLWGTGRTCGWRDGFSRLQMGEKFLVDIVDESCWVCVFFRRSRSVETVARFFHVV